MKQFLLLLSAFICTVTYSQGFNNATLGSSIHLTNPSPFLGSGVSFADFNRDGLDDVTFCVKGDSVWLYTNTGNGYFSHIEFFPNVMDAKQPVWVDYDNDGDSDFFFTRNNSTCKLYRNDGDMQFTDVTDDLNLPNSNDLADTFGCSWGDYDNDGWLDVYLCNRNMVQNVTNWLLHNNGDGTFTDVAAQLGVDNGERPSFQSVWIDFNFDGWLDLYVINDKFFENFLYQNTGSGSFVDVSGTTGSNVALDSMCNSVSDYDNDGDFDIYVTNNSEGNYLLNNDNYVFTDVAIDLGVAVHSHCWGSLWIDFDNDQDEDLHVSDVSFFNNDHNAFFVNNGDGTFSSDSDVGLADDNTASYSSAKGDFNSDGFYDFILHCESPDFAALWANDGIGGNWYKLGLQGVISNRDGIGTLIEYYTGGNRYLRFSQCGENYMGQDSQYEILGLGEFAAIDSLVLNWPSGWVDKYFNLDSDQFEIKIEGETFQPAITVNGQAIICTGGTLALDAGLYESYSWNNGSTDQILEVDEPGTYSVQVTNSFGFTAMAEITIGSTDPPEILFNTQSPACFGDENGTAEVQIIQGSTIAEIIWETSDETALIENLSSGTYSFTLTDSNGCIIEDSVSVTEPQLLQVSITASPVTCFGLSDGSAEPIISGGTGVIIIDWMGNDPLELAADDYTLVAMDENNCVETVYFSISQPDVLSVDIDVTNPCFGENGSAEVTATGGNGGYIYDWNGSDPDALPDGVHSVSVIDQLGCLLNNENFVVEENPEITATTQTVDADNGNNGSAQVDAEGGTPPYTYLWTNGSQSNIASSLGQGTYTCTITDDAGCELVVEIQIIDVGIGEFKDESISVFPNPFSSSIKIILLTSLIGEKVFIENALGQIVTNIVAENSSPEIETANWPAGVYIVRVGGKTINILKQ